jgi:serine/threonine protein kinase
MRQCKYCFRFVSESAKHCVYCDSKVLLHIPNIYFDTVEFANYKIYIESFIINNIPYKIEEPIARGGYSTVLKVSDPQGMFFALKLPFLFDQIFTNNQSFSPRSILKSSSSIAVEHKNIVKACDDSLLKVIFAGNTHFDVDGYDSEFPVILMELADTTLSKILTEANSGNIYLSQEEKQKIILDVLSSLQHLHCKDILHRDLSPDNIFVVNRGGEVRYVLGDLGSSKFFPSEYSVSHSIEIIGKKDYIDPERIRDPNFSHYDKRSDIFSLGVIVSEILLGNFWQNILPSTHSNPTLQFDNYTHSVLKMRLDSAIFKIIRKATDQCAINRYNNTDDFLKEISYYFDKISKSSFSKFSTDRKISLRCNFNFHLPINMNHQDHLYSKYSGCTTITIEDFTSHSIQFPNHIVSAKVFGTKLFAVNFDNNRIEIIPNKKHFLSLLREFIFSNSSISFISRAKLSLKRCFSFLAYAFFRVRISVPKPDIDIPLLNNCSGLVGLTFFVKVEFLR